MRKILSMAILAFECLALTNCWISLRGYAENHIFFNQKDMFSPTAGFPVSENFPVQERNCMANNPDSYLRYQLCMGQDYAYNMFDFGKGISIWMFFGLLVPFVNVIVLAALVYEFVK